jgi:acyl-CoA synthetase (AMP-forming)/AMP-acid ligase II
MPAAMAGSTVPATRCWSGLPARHSWTVSARCVTGSPTGYMPRGIGVGDRLALMVGNAPRMLALWVGALWARGIVAMLDTAGRAEGLAHLLKDSSPTLWCLTTSSPHSSKTWQT